MGTRADFYVGTGKSAEWLGSVAWDGYEWAEEPDCALLKAADEADFRASVAAIAKEREDWTNPEQGWPWPWNDSNTTDYIYYFAGGKAHVNDCDDWPDMSARKNVAWGNRSGVIVVGVR